MALEPSNPCPLRLLQLLPVVPLLHLVVSLESADSALVSPEPQRQVVALRLWQPGSVLALASVVEVSEPLEVLTSGSTE